MRYQLAILTTSINPNTIALMLRAAQTEAKHLGADIVSITKTVGCLDMPVVAQKLFQQDKIQGLVVLGAVAQGETKHDELVVNMMTSKIIDLSIKYSKPVGFGVIGPGAQPAQFKPRAAEYAKRAVEATVCNLDVLRA